MAGEPTYEDLEKKVKESKGKATERKHMEELGGSEQQWCSLFENLPSFITVTDHDGTIRYVNKTVPGLTVEETIGKNISDFELSEYHEISRNAIKDVFQSGLSGSYQVRGIGPDSTTSWYEIYFGPIRRNGQVVAAAFITYDITDRKRVEEKDKEISEHFRKLAEATFEGIVIIEKGVLVEANKTFSSLFGYQPAEVIGMKAIDLIAPESRELVSNNIASDYEGAYEATVLKKDGTRFEVEASGTPVSYRGHPARLTAMRDITARKRAEVATLESEAKYSAVVEQARDGIVIVQNGAFKYVNKGWEQISGYTKEELLGTPFLESLLPGSKELVAERTKQRLAGDPVIPVYEAQIRSKDGMTKTLEVSGGVIQYRGEPANVALMRDVTERKQTEQALQDSETKFRAIFNQSFQFIGLLSKDGTLLAANDTSLAFLGLSEAEVLGKPFWETAWWTHDAAQQDRLRDALNRAAAGEFVRFEAFLADGEGAIHINDLSLKPVKDEAGKVIYIIPEGRDITERRRMEEEITRTRKLESLGILAGGLAHDFNNLLTPILVNISMAKTYENIDPEIAEMLTDAEKASMRAKGLTQQLLTFAKGGAPIKKTIYISKLVEDTVKFALSGSNVRCEYSLPHDLWPVEVDEGQISQVIHNMVINADQAMAEGGTIRIRAENMLLGEEDHANLRAGGYVRISIEDQGHGIAQEQLSKIFDPFFTIKEKGRGLGLTTSLSIVTRHEGHIQVDSKMGKGTVFHIYLPSSENKPEIRIGAKNKPVRGEGKVLLIDDEEIVLRSAGGVLKRLGYEVRTEKDHAEAINLYEKAMAENHPFDVVIMDLTIPGSKGGQEAVKLLKEIDRDARVIVSSGYSDDRAMSQFREYGFCGVVAKPYEIEELARVIHNALKGEVG